MFNPKQHYDTIIEYKEARHGATITSKEGVNGLTLNISWPDGARPTVAALEIHIRAVLEHYYGPF